MQLPSGPYFSPLPSRDIDVVVVGAGAAGIAAARRLLAAGLSVAVMEARNRVGGRATTVSLKGHPIDLGAHWLHAGPINPLVRLGMTRREPLRRAPQEGHLIIGTRKGRPAERAAFDKAFDIADRALTRVAREDEDRPAASALPFLGPWRRRIATVHGLVSGRPLDEVSVQDFPSLEYGDNFFIAGGFGAYLARLAIGLPVRLAAAVRAITWSGPGVTIDSDAGSSHARAALVTLPIPVLQRDVVRFTPPLPEFARSAIHGFLSGTYEHVVLHWPNSPFAGPDRLASIVGGHFDPPGLLARIDGTPFHYFELDHPTAMHVGTGDPDRARRYARAVLAEHFGHRCLAGLSIPVVTEWRNDPWSFGSWAVVPPGRYPIRDALQQPVGERIWFAGEAMSHPQWGTVGGAWQEGEWAAGRIVAALRRGRPAADERKPRHAL